MDSALRTLAIDLGHGRPASEIVADAIRHLIAAGNLKPRDRLPPERELAPALGAARVTVRAALRILSEEGLVTTERGRTGGTVVCDKNTGSLEPSKSVGIFKEAIAELYEFRKLLEPATAQLAAERGSVAERRALRLLCEQPSNSQAKFNALDSRFHLLIAKMSRNSQILNAVERSREHFFILANSLFLRIDVAQFPSFADEHSRIAQAIGIGDEKAARREMANHIRRSHLQFLQALSRTTGSIRREAN